MNEQGQSLIEYALLIVLIAIVVIGILTILGTSVGDVFSQVVSAFDSFHSPLAVP